MFSRVDHELRKSASMLAAAVREKEYHSIVFASASRREGTTTVALYTALLLQQREGLRPLVIEINRERPVYAKRFGLNEMHGFAAIAAGDAGVDKCVQQGPSGIPVIPAGKSRKPPEAGADLASVLRRVLEQVKDRYDLVLIDAPAFLEDPDALTVCTVVPRLVLVVRAGRISSEVLQRIKQEIEQTVDGFILAGTILNRYRRYIPGWIHEWLLK